MRGQEEIRFMASKRYQTKEAIDAYVDGYNKAREDFIEAKKFQEEAMESLKERIAANGYKD